MTRKAASLLTKTQRRRLRNEFADLDEEKKRRDQQRIRERVRSGLLDFELLSDYPDEQFEMALDSMSDEEVRDALAETYLTVERFRELRGIEREELISTARSRGEDLTDNGAFVDVESLHRLELRTESETQRKVAAETSERLELNRWVKRANAAMVLGGGAVAVSTLFWLSDMLLGTSIWRGGITVIQQVIFLLIFAGVAGWTLIMTYHVLRNVAVPTVRNRMGWLGESA
ncbi:hypothetical protein [Haladaptatus sp. CMAA 1911]|uniref:hypothetical protein n=1 Tax=unclassified Haladaptatus TaxID=2622732 RepID=UPI0037549B42